MRPAPDEAFEEFVVAHSFAGDSFTFDMGGDCVEPFSGRPPTNVALLDRVVRRVGGLTALLLTDLEAEALGLITGSCYR